MKPHEKILVVEDDPEVREVLEELLRLDGFRVSGTDSGLRALLAIGRDRPACVVLDLRLRDISGFDVHRTIRAEPGFSRTPVLFISGAYSDEAAVRSLSGDAGARLLPKPIKREELLAAVRSLLS